MALTETIRDIENYPAKTKYVSLDLVKVVPIDNQGDEVYMLSAAAGTGTTASGSTAISPLYIREFKSGYARSSGKKNAPFAIIAGVNDQIQVSIDGSTFRTITLNAGNALSGDNIAADLQSKISNLADAGGLEVGNIAFLNVTVTFKNNRFNIYSGSISNTYTGTGRSSVKVQAGTNNAAVTLGFDIVTDSESLASKLPSETILTSGYTASDPSLAVSSTADFTASGAYTISDGTNREYFIAQSLTPTEITLSGVLANNYAAGSVVQKIFERDTEIPVAAPYSEIDEIIRFGLRAIASQVDFSI